MMEKDIRVRAFRGRAFRAVAVLSGALALAVSASVVPVGSAHAKAKCYGIAKAGENDCGNAAGTHSCAGHATVDYDGGEWKTVKKVEDCLAEGGSLEPFEGINPNKS